MVNQSKGNKNGSNSDKKDEILYRVVRILIILAIVWIVGTKFSEVSSTTNTVISENQAPVDNDDNINIDANVETNEEIQVPDSQTIDTQEQTEDLLGVEYSFRNDNLLTKHYEKHGIEMGFDSAEDYEAAASAVVNNPKALHKNEKEDGDDVYFVEDTEEFVVVSTDGYIRTYYYADLDYFNRQ